MKILFIDLASHSTLSNEGACIACVDEDHTKAVHFIDERIGDDGLMPAIEHTLASAAWTYEDLTHVACVIGPGGFTSLRMAVSLANVLSDQLKIPSSGIHLSEMYRARFPSPGPAGHPLPKGEGKRNRFIWLHSTKKAQLFARMFGMDDEPRLIGVNDVSSFVGARPERSRGAQDDTQWTGELIPEHREIVEKAGWKSSPLSSIADALPQLLKNQDYKQQILLPWYGRGW